jgi:hypothetical protein
MEKPEQVVQAIEEALQAEDLVLVRETDLECITNFLGTSHRGILHVVVEDDEGGPDQEADIECFYGRTPLGEYIIKWHSDSIEDVMTNGKTFLQATAGVELSTLRAVRSGPQIFFTRAREVFFGKVKTFVICTAGETDGHRQ